MSKTTPILLTTTVLSKAVDAILAACPTPAPGQRALTKSHLLNIVAKAIAGPKHDWGFLTGATGTVVARGVAQQAASTPAKELFFYQYDERDDWARAPRGPFATRADLLAHLAADHWWHSDDYPAEGVLEALKTQDEFFFYGGDDDSDGDASPYAITIFRYTMPAAQPTPAPEANATPPADPEVGYQILDATGDIYAPENGYAPATFELFADKADAQAFIDRQPAAVRPSLTIATVQAADIEDPDWV